jgi:hypothetical protein
VNFDDVNLEEKSLFNKFLEFFKSKKVKPLLIFFTIAFLVTLFSLIYLNRELIQTKLITKSSDYRKIEDSVFGVSLYIPSNSFFSGPETQSRESWSFISSQPNATSIDTESAKDIYITNWHIREGVNFEQALQDIIKERNELEFLLEKENYFKPEFHFITDSPDVKKLKSALGKDYSVVKVLGTAQKFQDKQPIPGKNLTFFPQPYKNNLLKDTSKYFQYYIQSASYPDRIYALWGKFDKEGTYPQFLSTFRIIDEKDAFAYLKKSNGVPENFPKNVHINEAVLYDSIFAKRLDNGGFDYTKLVYRHIDESGNKQEIDVPEEVTSEIGVKISIPVNPEPFSTVNISHDYESLQMITYDTTTKVWIVSSGYSQISEDTKNSAENLNASIKIVTFVYTNDQLKDKLVFQPHIFNGYAASMLKLLYFIPETKQLVVSYEKFGPAQKLEGTTEYIYLIDTDTLDISKEYLVGTYTTGLLLDKRFYGFWGNWGYFSDIDTASISESEKDPNPFFVNGKGIKVIDDATYSFKNFYRLNLITHDKVDISLTKDKEYFSPSFNSNYKLIDDKGNLPLYSYDIKTGSKTESTQPDAWYSAETGLITKN